MGRHGSEEAKKGTRIGDIEKGVVMGCARYGQSPNPTKTRWNKRVKSQISQSVVRTAREKDMSFLEDGASTSQASLICRNVCA